MPNASNLKVLRPDANSDALIAYTTDAQPQAEQLFDFLADRHPDGEAFASLVTSAGAKLLDVAATWDKERAEAVAATATQNEAFADAVAIIRKARGVGRYIVSELLTGNTTDARLKARKVKTACTIGVRADLRNQSGVRRVLTTLSQGLAEIADILAEWKAPEDLLPRVQTALSDIETVVKAQSREQLEADLARDRFEIEAEQTVASFNRIIRLLNGNAAIVPEASLTAFRSLEGDHPDVFYRSGTPDEPEAEPEPEEPAEAVA